MGIEKGRTHGTLEILETYNNKALCKCTRCNMTDVYNINALLESGDCICNTCKELNKKTLYKGDYEQYMKAKNIKTKLRAGCHVITNSNPMGKYKLGDKVNNMTVVGFIATLERDAFDQLVVGQAETIVLQCLKCNYTKILDLAKINDIDNIECPNCKKFNAMALKNVSDFNNNVKEHNKKISVKRVEKQKREEFPKVKSPLDNYKPGSAVAKHIEKINKNNPTLEITDIEPVGGTYTTKCKCLKCGAEVIIPYSLKVKKVECEGCKKLEYNPNFVGKFNRNWIGYTKNNLVIVEQDVNSGSCKVTCKNCIKTQDDVKLADMLHGKVYCNCDELRNDTSFDFYCASCGKPLTIRMSQVVGKRDNSKDLICNNCKKPSGVTIQQLVNEQYARDEKSTTCNKLHITIKKYKDATITHDRLVQENTPVFVGTDGNDYYRCRCLDHGVDMVLNENEIANFDHSACEDGRQHAVDDLNIDDLRL